MTDSRKRVDVSVGGFACSLQGFEDPGAALTAILRAMREAGDLALGAPLFDAPTMARLGREIGALAGNGAVSVAPGLVLRWQAGERTVEELGERLDPGADLLGPAAGELAADTLGDATPEPFEAPATSVDASPDMVHPPGTDATPDEVERDGPEASDATAAGETPEDEQASHEGLPDAGRTAEAEARVSEPEPDREKPDAPDTPVRDALDVEDTTPAETAGAVEAGADAAEAPAAEGTAPPPSADAGTAQVSDKADEAAGRDEPGPAWKGIAEVSNRSIFDEPEDEPEEAEVADFESSTPLPVEGGDAPAAIEPLEPARQSASVVSIFGEPEEDHATAAGSAADGAQSGARDALDPSIFSDPDAEATATPDAAEGGPDDRSAPLPEPDRTARSIFADPDDPYPDNQEPAHDAREDADVEETVGGSHEATVFSRDDDGDTGSEATAAGIDLTFTDPDGPEPAPAPDADEAAGAEQAPTEAAIFAEDEGEAAAVEPGAEAEPGSIFGPDEAADEAPTPPDAEAAGERSIFDDPDQEPEEPNIFDDDAEEAEPAPAATPNVFAGEADNVTPLKGRVHEFRRFLRTQTTTDHAVEEIPLRDVSLAEIVKTARAEQVPDLMSVSAAWLSLVKGHRTFTRKEVIAVFEEIEGPHSRSLEAKIKGFGRLLRNGQIQNAEDDRFTLSPRERERYAALIG